MTNENCLAEIKCPRCGNEARFFIECSVLADVTGGGLAGLASDLGVEAEELEAIVNHPDFERDVREEVARIAAG